MEAYPFAANNKNNCLSCEDVMKASRILRSSLADPQRAFEDARSFAEKVSPADKTLNEFIAKIVRQDNDSSQTYTVQNTFDDSNWQHGEDALKKKNVYLYHRLCIQLLDLVILCMAAASNFTAKETNWKSTEKCLPPYGSLEEESEKAKNSFRAFSWKMWKKGIESVGLLKDRAAASAVAPEDEGRSKKDDNDIIIKNNNKDTKDKDDLGATQTSTHNAINRTGISTSFKKTSKPLVEKTSPSTVAQAIENTIRHGDAQSCHTRKDNIRAGVSPQRKAKRKLPNLADSFLKSDLNDDRAEEEREHTTATLNKLQFEKEILQDERNALQSETETLIKENREIKASLRNVETEKENLTRECKQLQVQFEEQERRSRQHAFILNTRLERLQHSKLAAVQGCLKLSLKQERLVMYEQQVALMCLRMMKTVKLELEQTHDLFNVATVANCSCSVVNSTCNEGPSDGEGLTMFEAHHELEKQILELIKRYRTVIRLLTEAKGNRFEKRREHDHDEHFLTIEERNRDSFPQHGKQFALHSAPTTESDSSCCVSIYDGGSARDIRHSGIINTANKRAANERRGNSLTTAKDSTKRGGQGVCGHGEQFTCQRKVDDIKSETVRANFFTKIPSSYECPTSDVTRYRRNSLDTLNDGQRLCSCCLSNIQSDQLYRNRFDEAEKYAKCSVCRKNREETRRVKKSMSVSCGRRARPFKEHAI